MSACPALPLWPAVRLILPPLDASGRLQEDPHDFSSVCVPRALGVSRLNGAPPAGSRLLCSARRPAPRLPVSSLPGRPVAFWTISSPQCGVATGASPAFGRGVFSHTVPELNAGGRRTQRVDYLIGASKRALERRRLTWNTVTVPIHFHRWAVL